MMSIDSQTPTIVKIKREEEFRYERIPKMYKKDPSKVTYSMLQLSRDTIGPFGTERIRFLKEQFNNIIENCLTHEMKSLLFTYDHIPLYKWLKLKQGCKKKYTDYEAGCDPFVAKVLLNDICLSQKGVDFFKNNGRDLMRNIFDARKWARKLVTLRNKLFRSLREIHNFRPVNEGIQLLFPATIEDYMQIFGTCLMLKETKYFSKWNMLKIKKKDEDKEYSSEVELTDSDEEEAF